MADLQLKGSVRIFVKEVETKKKNKYVFSTCIGSKFLDEDSGWINAYMLVNFSNELKAKISKCLKKDVTMFDCILKHAWFSAFADKEGHIQPVLFVNDAKLVMIEDDEDEEDEDDEEDEPKPKAKKTTSKK